MPTCLKVCLGVMVILINLTTFGITTPLLHAEGVGTKVGKVSIPYSIEQIANAIYKAEGGNKTRHPYGILKKYKHTTPRQACINTIKHAKADWNGKGDFIVVLGSRYCPVNAHPLNRNWVKNVKYFLDSKV